MACGKPVVASRVGIVGEIIEDGMDGFICKTGDVDSFVERIKFLLMSPEKRMQIGSNGRIKIEKNFNMDIFINNMEDAYYSVIEGNEDRA
jgi:glycosyltransferase involved in cell wall biosynthesis